MFPVREIRIPNQTDPAFSTPETKIPMTLHSHIIGRLSNFHTRGPKPDIFIFATPRSGSTFIMELLDAQPRVKVFNEPLNIRMPVIRAELGAMTWRDVLVREDRRELFAKYFNRLRRNAVPQLNTAFFHKEARFFTNRNVFKVIHGGEDMIDWFETTFGADILVLMRHPIPTALSHYHYPRLPHFLEQPEYKALFSSRQIALIERTIEDGSEFEQGIVNWCIQCFPALVTFKDAGWAVVSYEDLTIHPEATVAYLEKMIHLDPIPNLRDLVNRPSESTVQSDATTHEFFETLGESSSRMFLVDKWKARISQADEARAMEFLSEFAIDYYEPGNLFPADKYRIPGTIG